MGKGFRKQLQYVGLACILFFGLTAIVGTGGSGEEGGGGTGNLDDETEIMFEKAHVLDVQIALDPDDWEVLRSQGRGLAMAFSQCEGPYDYTYFDGTVTIDGNKIEHTGIRKKGNLGSLSTLRPSLKINFGTFTPDQKYSGMKRMTLNNDRQDPSHTHQVMSYALFRQAGVVAPRCNFARVTVNGKDLGTYSHVESIKKPFLARHFDDNDGNLYEGQSADFMPDLVSNFERKTNEGDGEPDRSDLDRVVAALNVEDTELVAALEQVVDLEAFMTFWAMEVILGHWDGFTGDRNNFYIYCDPKTNLFYFIPWGTDGAFTEGHSFLPTIPNSVYAVSKLAHRLYNYAETRALYHEKLTSLLNTIWNEDDLLAEVDRIKTLVSPLNPALEMQREFLSNRKSTILAELVNGGPAWPYPLYPQGGECDPPVEISGTFSAIFSAEEKYVPGDDVSLMLTLDGEPQTFTLIANTANPEGGDFVEKTAMIGFYAPRPEGNPLFVGLFMPPEMMQVGVLPFHGFETFGIVLDMRSASNPIRLGWIGDGAIHFDTAETYEGGKVSGSFSGMFTQL